MTRVPAPDDAAVDRAVEDPRAALQLPPVAASDHWHDPKENRT